MDPLPFGKFPEPIVRPFETFGVWTRDQEWKYYIAEYIEPLPPSEDLVVDFGSIDALGTLEKQKVEEVEMDNDEIAQLRVVPLDDITVLVKQPVRVIRHKLKKRASRLTPMAPITPFNAGLDLTEMFVHEDTWPILDLENPTEYDTDVSRVMFFGWRIIGEETEKPEKPYTVIHFPSRGV